MSDRPIDNSQVAELEQLFLGLVGVTRKDFYRLFQQDVRRLLAVVAGTGAPDERSRALASRALAYMVQDKDAVPDDQLLGHVDDYVVVLAVLDELFPDEVQELSAESLLRNLPAEAQERTVRSMELVLESKESFPASALRKPVIRALQTIRHRLGDPRDILTLVRTVLPGIAFEMFGSAVLEGLENAEDGDF